MVGVWDPFVRAGRIPSASSRTYSLEASYGYDRKYMATHKESMELPRSQKKVAGIDLRGEADAISSAHMLLES